MTYFLIYSNRLLNVGDENHHKAILALVFRKQLHLVTDHLPYFALVFDSLTKAPCVLFLNQLIRKPTPYFIDHKNNRLLRAPSTGLLTKPKATKPPIHFV
jgi:hypothetical protein